MQAGQVQENVSRVMWDGGPVSRALGPRGTGWVYRGGMGHRRHCMCREGVRGGSEVFPSLPKLAPALGLTVEQLQDTRVSRQMLWPSLCLRVKSPPPLKPLWQLRLGGLSLSSSNSISNPRKQQTPSSCPPMPGNCKGAGEDAGK